MDGFMLSQPYIDGLRTRLIDICLVTDVLLISSFVLNYYLEWILPIHAKSLSDANGRPQLLLCAQYIVP